ncbi:calmodulin-alpha [Lingula anatina]|uniref:Calmodulin-alpha n=1 Tax=Lingula anatina TaxID=7574 RepID=A0A1S3JYC0_LINAN|nr:calmodulin-alpha [Lingula anatina]XP_013415054.1 calmodulin-alpha [Lingula anatina]XP_013415055.1 calmodulin-alpha [Lingula anatina]|eukprot:XP_013415053.1 calmodulin-alpha [Lingula anatina]
MATETEEDWKKKFTEKQLAKYRALFNLYDINKDGTVSVKELAAVSKKFGYNLDKQQIEAIIQRWDGDKKGCLNFQEFINAMPGNAIHIPRDEHKRAELRIHFREFDKSGSGFISEQEATDVLSKELAFPHYKSKAYMKFFDKNKDGKLNIDEFADFYEKVEEKKGELIRIFKEFDANGDGYVDIYEAQEIMRQFDIADDEIEKMVLENDKDGDKKLNWDEFVHFWGTD